VWFEEVEEGQRDCGAPDAPWRRDMDMAFLVALFLRAAEHSLRYRVPLQYF